MISQKEETLRELPELIRKSAQYTKKSKTRYSLSLSLSPLSIYLSICSYIAYLYIMLSIVINSNLIFIVLVAL